MAAIDDLITDARVYAASILTNAGMAMQAAMQAIANLAVKPPGDDTVPPLKGDPPKPPDGLKVEPYSGSSYTPLLLQDLPPDIKDPGSIAEPADPGQPPGVAVYRPPSAPTMTVPDPHYIGLPPALDIEEIVADIPEPPELQGKVDAIPVPPISDITLPPPPQLVLPVYHPGTPAVPPPPPTNLDELLREQYELISPIMRNSLQAEFERWIDFYYPTLRQGVAAMEAKLDTFLLGGTGLTPAVEDAIYNRNLDKDGAEAARALDKVYTEAAKLGFTTLPPLALQQAKEVDQGYRDNLARAANEIMVKNAELEQQNIQFALTLRNNASTAHMQAAISYHSQLVQINGQALQYAIASVEQVVKIYNLAIEYARVTIQLEEARIKLYETQLKAAMAVLEFYKAQIEGELAKVTVDKARVELYTAQLNAILIESTIYKTEMEGSKLRGDIEKLKVELYGENVKAYAAQVSAYSAGWSGYEAAVRGAMADVNASVEQVRGYSAKAEYNRTLLTSRITSVEGKLRLNDGKVKLYGEQVAAISAANRASADSVKAEHDSYDSVVRAKIAEAQLNGEYYRAEVSYFEVTRRALIESVQIMLAEFAEANKLATVKAQAISQVSSAVAHDYAATAQAALSGLNTLAGKVETTAAPSPA